MNRNQISFFLYLLIAACAVTAQAQATYQKPPKAITDVLDAPANPMASVSPSKDRMILAQPVRYPSIAELAEPMLRLAGSRINPKTNGPHRPFFRIVALTLKNIADGKETKLAVPPNANLSMPVWSQNGTEFAVMNTTATGVELWVGDGPSGKLRKMPGIAINDAFGDGMQWMPDGKTLLAQTIPANRGPAPVAPAVPEGPNVQENYGKVSPAPTFHDLLRNAHDEKLFDYYATSQLALVNTATGKSTPLGKPAIFDSIQPAPDGNHILVATNHRPYSYLLPQNAFPKEVEVWDRSGKVVHKLASLPLADQVPIEGVPTGPRNYSWRPTSGAEPATLVWVEALDGGDTKKKAPLRDVVKMLKAPFTGSPVELMKTEHRFAGTMWGEKNGLVFVNDFDRNRRWSRGFQLNADDPSQAPRVIWDRSIQDRYNNPGSPVMKRLTNGRMAIQQDGDEIFLFGQGATPKGDRPFLNRFNLKTLKTETIFRCDDTSYESFVSLLSDDGSRFITSYETPSLPPNLFLRSSGGKQALTDFKDPTPQLRGIKKQLVRYKRKDGVDLSFTLYLPPDYKEGTRLPTLVWAYPIEFSDAGVAGQVGG
ncbi:MAG: S9 family peptidase, partial [Blastocatellia bacterium]